MTESNPKQTKWVFPVVLVAGAFSLWWFVIRDKGSSPSLTTSPPPTTSDLDDVPGYWYLDVITPKGGTCNPTGHNKIPTNNLVNIYATTGVGYYFDGWYLDDILLSRNKTYQIPPQIAGSTHKLEARFIRR